MVLILTRWREDDLAGWLINQANDNPDTYRIKLLRIPAISESAAEREAARKMGLPAEDGDPIDRPAGVALCDEIKTLEEHLTRKQLSPNDFYSLDQGLPRPVTGYLVSRKDFKIVPYLPDQGFIKWAWCIDFAYTEKEQAPKTRHDPDFTAVSKIGAWYPDANNKHDVRIIIAHVKKEQLKISDAKNMIKDHILGIGGQPCPIVAFSQNIDKIGIESLAVDPDLFAYQVKLFKSPYPKSDKVVMATPWLSRASLGFVYLLMGKWNTNFLDEVEMFPRGSHDDQVDMVSVGFYWHGLAKIKKQVQTRKKPKGWFS